MKNLTQNQRSLRRDSEHQDLRLEKHQLSQILEVPIGGIYWKQQIKKCFLVHNESHVENYAFISSMFWTPGIYDHKIRATLPNHANSSTQERASINQQCERI